MSLPNTSASGGIGMQDIIANYKEIYGEFKDLVPAELKMCDLVKFAAGDKQVGREFHEPVVLSMEGGFTYGGTQAGIFDLNKYVGLSIQDAKVTSVEMVLRSAISVGAVNRSAKDSNSFKRGLRLLIGNMQKSMYHRLEVALLYGQDSIAIVKAAALDVDTSKIVVDIEESEWASGIWVGTNKHKIDALTPTLSAKRAHVGAVATIVDSYSFEKKQVVLQTVDSQNQPTTNVSTTIAAGDKLFFQGEVIAGVTPTHLNMKGLKAIAEERVSLFSISNAGVPLFQGNVVDCGTLATPAKLDFMTVEKAAARSAEKGVAAANMDALVSVDQWNDLLEDQAAKRRYSGSEVGTLKEGARALEFYGQTGAITIVPSTYVKGGYSFVFNAKDLSRIGATDVTMEPPGFEGDPIRYLEEANGYQARAYSDQALFTSKPGSISVIRYIEPVAAQA